MYDVPRAALRCAMADARLQLVKVESDNVAHHLLLGRLRGEGGPAAEEAAWGGSAGRPGRQERAGARAAGRERAGRLSGNAVGWAGVRIVTGMHEIPCSAGKNRESGGPRAGTRPRAFRKRPQRVGTGSSPE